MLGNRNVDTRWHLCAHPMPAHPPVTHSARSSIGFRDGIRGSQTNTHHEPQGASRKSDSPPPLTRHRPLRAPVLSIHAALRVSGVRQRRGAGRESPTFSVRVRWNRVGARARECALPRTQPHPHRVPCFARTGPPGCQRPRRRLHRAACAAPSAGRPQRRGLSRSGSREAPSLQVGLARQPHNACAGRPLPPQATDAPARARHTMPQAPPTIARSSRERPPSPRLDPAFAVYWVAAE